MPKRIQTYSSFVFIVNRVRIHNSIESNDPLRLSSIQPNGEYTNISTVVVVRHVVQSAYAYLIDAGRVASLSRANRPCRPRVNTHTHTRTYYTCILHTQKVPKEYVKIGSGRV